LLEKKVIIARSQTDRIMKTKKTCGDRLDNSLRLNKVKEANDNKVESIDQICIFFIRIIFRILHVLSKTPVRTTETLENILLFFFNFIFS